MGAEVASKKQAILMTEEELWVNLDVAGKPINFFIDSHSLS